jgi:hypothetical protein
VVRFAEGPLTRLRREVKVLLAPEEAIAVAARLGAELGAPSVTDVAAVYFDGPDALLARGALESPRECVKIRAKAYRPDRSAAPGRVVLEVKRERGDFTVKERHWLDRAAVRAALAAAHPGAGPLSPVVATSYRRRVFQPCAGWRATIDDELRFHAAGWALFHDAAPAWPRGLGPALAIEPRAVLELKLGTDEPPGWLRDLALARATPFSKFAEALARTAPARMRGA